MHLVDEIFRDFKEKGYIEELIAKKDLADKFEMIRVITSQVNVFKAELENLSLDEQLYLDFKLQDAGVDLGLCPEFYMFFSNKNNKFHFSCNKNNKCRTGCKGKLENCEQLNN
ncbi:MAG: hypothetical protein ACOYL8_04610 [Patescibacteria group bacterium]